MLTPQEITKKEFDKAVIGGYVMASVDEFLVQLGQDYSALYKENAILKNKIKVLVDKVEEYRSTEDAMRMALLSAKKTAREINEEAESQKQQMLAEAEDAAVLRRRRASPPRRPRLPRQRKKRPLISAASETRPRNTYSVSTASTILPGRRTRRRKEPRPRPSSARK